MGENQVKKICSHPLRESIERHVEILKYRQSREAIIKSSEILQILQNETA